MTPRLVLFFLMTASAAAPAWSAPARAQRRSPDPETLQVKPEDFAKWSAVMTSASGGREPYPCDEGGALFAHRVRQPVGPVYCVLPDGKARLMRHFDFRGAALKTISSADGLSAALAARPARDVGPTAAAPADPCKGLGQESSLDALLACVYPRPKSRELIKAHLSKPEDVTAFRRQLLETLHADDEPDADIANKLRLRRERAEGWVGQACPTREQRIAAARQACVVRGGFGQPTNAHSQLCLEDKLSKIDAETRVAASATPSAAAAPQDARSRLCDEAKAELALTGSPGAPSLAANAVPPSPGGPGADTPAATAAGGEESLFKKHGPLIGAGAGAAFGVGLGLALGLGPLGLVLMGGVGLGGGYMIGDSLKSRSSAVAAVEARTDRRA